MLWATKLPTTTMPLARMVREKTTQANLPPTAGITGPAALPQVN